MYDNLFKNPLNRNSAMVQMEERQRYYQPDLYFLDLTERIQSEEHKEREGDCLKRALKTLTIKQRKCLTLSAVYELKQRQISEHLGISQRVVSQHISYAKKKVIKYFDKNFN
tara:strand:+ start:392 stop:727 length:336 start_codon:yes stop_codon:yes gene_type:complete